MNKSDLFLFYMIVAFLSLLWELGASLEVALSSIDHVLVIWSECCGNNVARDEGEISQISPSSCKNNV